MIPTLERPWLLEPTPAPQRHAPAPASRRMLRGVLVPLDGSELAEQALSVGAALARRAGATLHLVSVHEPVPLTAMPPDYPMPVMALEAEARGDRVQYLDTVAAAVRASLPSPVVASVVTGSAASSLCEYMETHPVDVVVMTTHGRGGLRRLCLGSVAEKLVRGARVPVLVVPAGVDLEASIRLAGKVAYAIETHVGATR